MASLYLQYRLLLMWHALRILDRGASTSTPDAEDVVHDTFVRLLERPPHHISKGLLVTAVKRTAMNRARANEQTFNPYTEVKKPTTSLFPTQVFACRLGSATGFSDE